MGSHCATPFVLAVALRESEWGDLYPADCGCCKHNGNRAYLGHPAPCVWAEETGPIIRIKGHPPVYQCPRAWLRPYVDAVRTVAGLYRHWRHGAIQRRDMSEACADALVALECASEAWEAERLDELRRRQEQAWQRRRN